jgi:hypothetical protein
MTTQRAWPCSRRRWRFVFQCIADDTAGTTTTSTTAAQQPDETTRAFCEANAELDRKEAPPTADELQALARVALPEIKEDVELVAERVAAEGTNAFDDPAVREAVTDIDRWREENCAGAGEG